MLHREDRLPAALILGGILVAAGLVAWQATVNGAAAALEGALIFLGSAGVSAGFGIVMVRWRS